MVVGMCQFIGRGVVTEAEVEKKRSWRGRRMVQMVREDETGFKRQ